MRSETVLEGPGVGSRCILRNKSTSLGWVTLPLCSCPPSAWSFALCAFWNFRFHCLPDLSFWNAQVFQNDTLRDLFERKATGFVMFSLSTCSYPVAWQIFFALFQVSSSDLLTHLFFFYSPMVIKSSASLLWKLADINRELSHFVSPT